MEFLPFGPGFDEHTILTQNGIYIIWVYTHMHTQRKQHTHTHIKIKPICRWYAAIPASYNFFKLCAWHVCVCLCACVRLCCCAFNCAGVARCVHPLFAVNCCMISCCVAAFVNLKVPEFKLMHATATNRQQQHSSWKRKPASGGIDKWQACCCCRCTLISIV